MLDAVIKKDWDTVIKEIKTFYTDPEDGQSKPCTERNERIRDTINKNRDPTSELPPVPPSTAGSSSCQPPPTS